MGHRCVWAPGRIETFSLQGFELKMVEEKGFFHQKRL